jgi:hypothetical protein
MYSGFLHIYTPLPSQTSWPITTVDGHQCYVAGTRTIKVLVQLSHMVEVVLLENVLYVPGLQCERRTVTLLRTLKSSSQITIVLFKTCIFLISVSLHRMFMDFVLLHMRTFHSKRSINPFNCGIIALISHLHFDISRKWFLMVQLQVFISQLTLNCVLLVNLGR